MKQTIPGLFSSRPPLDQGRRLDHLSKRLGVRGASGPLLRNLRPISTRCLHHPIRGAQAGKAKAAGIYPGGR
jgi:hypothetical protein